MRDAGRGGDTDGAGLRNALVTAITVMHEARREVWGAGRGVQAGEVETPAMAAEAGRETRRGAESDEESDGCNGAQDSARVYGYGYATHIKPQGFISRPPLLTTNKVF